jgi:hypothetical protein
MGWFMDRMRHKNAKTYGHAGGMYRSDVRRHNTIVIREHPDGSNEVVHDPNVVEAQPPRIIQQPPQKKGLIQRIFIKKE